MRRSTTDLFGIKPRKRRQWLMHVSDAYGDGEDVVVTFACAKCGKETDWVQCDTVTEAKRGIPCLDCNKKLITDGGEVK